MGTRMSWTYLDESMRDSKIQLYFQSLAHFTSGY